MDEVIATLLRQKAFLTTAESCTGGMLGMQCTDIAGSSSWYTGGVITYSNELKQSLLGVKADVLAKFGAVSEEVALAMAEGALKRIGADYAISVTGIAGPDGGSEKKPVGTVFIGTVYRREEDIIDSPQNALVERYQFSGERHQIRHQACVAAMNQLRALQQQLEQNNE